MGKNPFGIDFGAIGDAMKGLQNAYKDGLGAMTQAGSEATEDMEPSHKIIIDVKASANVENHPYKIDAHLEFLADLTPILNAQTGDIASLLGGLGVDLSEEESGQVVEQLSKPRCIAKLDNSKIKEIELHSEDGKIEEGINKNATMLITADEETINLSFESALSLPELQARTTIYYAIPSQEEMQKNVIFDKKKMDKKISFSWTEKDKDNLKIEGTAKIEEL